MMMSKDDENTTKTLVKKKEKMEEVERNRLSTWRVRVIVTVACKQ
jgi:hypothetical protein